ncbi:hypothetical protein D9758_017749 [Tetrapyrgos nigripes]|uniref:Kinesin light chain n=1 Tax=Tetrapyrgos nigripes TaxID=182062 RepID=A0A8H5F8U1_9AGAR|nr:hypothetical protein D9758_017749 [Tetrapyrgos nigripes]
MSHTQHLLQICAFFHHKAIPIQLFQRAATFAGDDVLQGEEISGMAEMQEFLKLFEDNHLWKECVDELCQFSLASYDNKTEVLALHSVIHACSRETVDVVESKRNVAYLIIGCATPLEVKDKDYQFRRYLWDHASYMYGGIMPTVFVRICLAQILGDAGMWTQAEQLEEEVLGVRREELGEHHPDTLTSMANLASTYRARGKLEAAEQLEEEVLGVRREGLGEHHPDTLTSMANLASTYKARGKLEAAEQLEEEVLGVRREGLGERHP